MPWELIHHQVEGKLQSKNTSDIILWLTDGHYCNLKLHKSNKKIGNNNRMGTCQTNNTVADLPAEPAQIPQSDQAHRTSSNPFYELNETNTNDYNILSKYSFHSKYNDQYLGDCSVIQ